MYEWKEEEEIFWFFLSNFLIHRQDINDAPSPLHHRGNVYGEDLYISQ
jgi:hypothetical protein